MTKEEKLVDLIVDFADQYMGGERSRTAGPMFIDIASACREMGYTELADIMRRVAFHYLYD